MESVTLVAPLVVHRSSISVGALHGTGDGGVMRKSVMRTVDVVFPADVGGVAAAVVVDGRAVGVVGLVETGAVEAAVPVGRVEVVSTDVAGLVLVEDDEP
jgi:hypothetical protein